MPVSAPMCAMLESTEGDHPSPSGSGDKQQVNKESAEERRKEAISKSCSPRERTHFPATLSADTAGASQDTESRCSPPNVDLRLSPAEQHVLVSLSSLDFGFVVVHDTEESACDGGTARTVQRSLLLKAVALWTRAVADDPSLDCRLGHVFLLLEEFEKAKLHYERYGGRYGNSTSDVSYLYGMGLVYFHFDHLHGERAAECFRMVLSESPSFPRGNEAILRLAILAHKQGNYEQALKDFTLVYEDPRACSLTGPEVLVYIGHLQAILKRPVEAVDVFNRILATPNISQKLTSLVYRKLGWLYHTCAALDVVCPMRSTKALEMLNSAVGASPSCWHAWFLLGRYHEAQGKVQEAFLALRHAISKDSTRPEVWFAIGKLYHQQAQASDAVQAYLSAIYIDPAHTLSWCNLAILYQSVDQEIDALVCYENAQRNASKTDPMLATVDSKIDALRHTVSTNYHQLCAQARFIPALVEAWPRLVAPLVRQQQKEPQLPIMSPTNLQVSSPAPPQSPAFSAFGSLPGRERDKHKTQEPIIISRGLIQPSLCSPTCPPNQVAPSATPMCPPQDMWTRPPAPPLGHSNTTQWGNAFPGPPSAYQSSGVPYPQGNSPVLPTFEYRSMDQLSSATLTSTSYVPHNLPPDFVPGVLPATRPLPQLSRDDVLDVLDSIGSSFNQGVPLDHADPPPTHPPWSHQDVFGDLALHPVATYSTLGSSTSLPATLHHEAGVENGCHGYSRSLQPSPDPGNQSTCVSRKRQGTPSSLTDHKRMYQGSNTHVASSGPAPTQTAGFPSYLKDVCSVESASQYAAGAQGVSLANSLANHCASYVHSHWDAVSVVPPASIAPLPDHRASGHVFHQDPQHAACVDSTFLSSLCDLASDQHMAGSPPHFAANSTPLLQIGLDQQRFM